MSCEHQSQYFDKSSFRHSTWRSSLIDTSDPVCPKRSMDPAGLHTHCKIYDEINKIPVLLYTK